MRKVYIKTYGCSMNQADSENMAGILKNAEYQIVENEDDAELIIVNSCTVKGPTEDKILRYIKDKKAEKRNIVVAGCIPQATPEKVSGLSSIGTYQIQNIAEVVDETLEGNTVTLIAREKESRANLPKKRSNPHIEIISINSGCLGSCTFCLTKQARGQLHSYPKRDLLLQAKTALKEGVKEFWLTSQDTACYGFDINENLPSLINGMSAIPGKFKIRIGMGNPDHFIKIIDELVQAYQSDKVYKFLHLPIQAGSIEVLKNMHRMHGVEEFKTIIKKMRESYPNITIATDIIVGFPGETEEQFNETLDLVKETRPDAINISRFWPRPNTAAAKMKQLNIQIVKERTKRLTQLHEKIALENNWKWKNWEGNVKITEKGKHHTLIGRNDHYKQIILPESPSLQIGDTIIVKVKEVATYDLRAVPIIEKTIIVR